MAFGEMGGIWLKGESLLEVWGGRGSFVLGFSWENLMIICQFLFLFLFSLSLQISHDHQMRSKWGNLGGNWVVGGRLGFWGEM